MAAVILEEWLQELAAIAQEHTVLTNENFFAKTLNIGLLNPDEERKKDNNNSAILETPPVMILANEMEASMS